ncbi:MAG: response regulator [Candidatus Kerfeldbacteria bacterium]|nr:response regulator [Candidatus Kerfeldbacteria bacterium]
MADARTILLVEDEPIIAELYRAVLATRDYDVVTAFNKQSALTLIQERTPRVVLLDLMIPLGPGESLVTYDHPVGFDILEWMHHHAAYKSIPVMVVTNLESDQFRKHAESLGIAGYFVKANLDPKDLLRHVDSIAQNRK